MKQRSAAFWRNGFFGGIIGLNVLLLFRAAALTASWPTYLLWAAGSMACGVLVLKGFFELRRSRLSSGATLPAKAESQPPAQNRAERRREKHEKKRSEMDARRRGTR